MKNFALAKISASLLLALSFLPADALALTREQKIADFTHIARMYGTNYAPYHWKKEFQKFDMLDMRPWIAKIEQTKDDLDYLEVVVEYVSSLNDAHDSFSIFSIYQASLGFNTDIYDGKVLIDGISRARLPVARYPFTIGDELVKLDGRPVMDWIKEFRKYSANANPRSTDRGAASMLTFHAQALMPSLSKWQKTESEVEILRANGNVETYTLPWQILGDPLMEVSPPPALQFGKQPVRGAVEEYGDLFGDPFSRTVDDLSPAYMAPMHRFTNVSVKTQYGVIGYGSPVPVYGLPAGFQLRLRGAASEFFVSGTYESQGVRIGLIRIPSYAPPSIAAMTDIFEREIAYMQATTDGLVIDDMRNPGGAVAFCNAILQRLIPRPFDTMAFEVKATSAFHNDASLEATLAELQGADRWIVDSLRFTFKQVEQAYKEGGRTGPIALATGTGQVRLFPANNVYTKPIIMLADEYSASGGDYVPAVLQDQKRAKIMGYRTMGAGGSVIGWDAAPFSQGQIRTTASLMVRSEERQDPGYPRTRYVENVGVHPDIPFDYMTRENLMSNGALFVRAFTEAIVSEVRLARPQ